MSLVLEAASGQLLGERERQNDACLYSETFALVADGVGSHVAASAVAQAAVQVWARASTGPDLLDAPALAAAELDAAGLGASCTLAGAVLDAGGLLWVTAVGDSQVLVVRGQGVLVATTAHNSGSYRRVLYPGADVNAYDMAELTRFVAAGTVHVPEVQVLRPRPGDVVVAMSDGVHAVLPPGQVAALVSRQGSCEQLVADVLDAVRAAGARDNATCVVARVVAEDLKGGEGSW